MRVARRIGTAVAALALVGAGALAVAPQAEAATWKKYHSMVQTDTLLQCQGRLSNQVRMRSAEGARIGAIDQCHRIHGGYRGSFHYWMPLKTSR
ncbi:hypothetical protein [Desertihabitans aurantiacus]|uniref:hypothetical protein n=1 Tax=Desertihabitans aurantiacus TaxID=2282477 RepID=UPI001300814C|nr:hypothetical protein [Desertihabitans aurantiacus]